MVNFGDAIKKGVRFAADPSRWMPLLALDGIFLIIMLAALLSNLSEMMMLSGSVEANPLAFVGIFQLIIGFVLLGTAWVLMRLWVLGALIHQSIRANEMRQSYSISIGRLHVMVGAIALVTIIATIGAMVPYIGFIISLVLGWMFFFALQGVMVDRMGPVQTLRSSYNIFRKYPFDVFISWLLITLISAGIFIIFALPLIASMFGIMFTFLLSSSGGAPNAALLLAYVMRGVLPLVVYGVIALIGFEASQAFSVKAQTELYGQLRKGKAAKR
jgi:hypothetical protein